ncbi:MAG: hypothetical protein NT030_07545 [Candidatus Saganbacteria bacterium]|nr:hypothetical protein [Candidatus Saganbacteria bacterium]
MDYEALELKIQKNHPDLRIIKQFKLLHRLNHSLLEWMKTNYSNNELKSVYDHITQWPLGGSTAEIWVHNYLYWERRKRIKKIYRRYKEDIWNTVIGEYREENDLYTIAILSKIECVNQIGTSAADFEELMVRNALKITSQRILRDIKLI